MMTQIRDGLWHVDCQTLDKPNVYIIDDGDVTLVDAGWPGDEPTVREGLHTAGVQPAEIDRVLLTHYDPDHIGTLSRLTPELDAPIYIHKMEAPYIAGDQLPPWTSRHGLNAVLRLYTRYTTLPNLPVCPIEDGDTLGGFQAYHTPGHTIGHMAYIHDELSAGLLGDLVYEWSGHLRASGFVTSYDTGRVTESISSLLSRTDDFRYVCPGHGCPLSGGHALLSSLIG